ncbi:MAG: hypothetical protein NZ898_13730 [Myxococcota bacterium]|nr:hypothetical protein [Myxococcota bacterium]
MKRLRRVVWTCACVGLASLAGAASAGAQARRPLGESVSVSSSAADDCLVHAPLVEAIGAWLNRAELDARLLVLVEASERTASFTVMRDGEITARRRFERLPSTCADRRALVSLAVALALDHTLLDVLAAEPSPVTDSPHEAPTEGDATPPTAVTSDAARHGTARARPTSDWTASIGAWVGPRIARTGMGAVALSLGIDRALSSPGASRAHVRLEIAASDEHERGLDRGVLLSRWIAARLAGCLAHDLGGARVEGCAGLESGLLLARGSGYDENRSVTLGFAAGLLAAGLVVPVAAGLEVAARGQAAVAPSSLRLEVRALDGRLLESATVLVLAPSTGVELRLAVP